MLGVAWCVCRVCRMYHDRWCASWVHRARTHHCRTRRRWSTPARTTTKIAHQAGTGLDLGILPEEGGVLPLWGGIRCISIIIDRLAEGQSFAKQMAGKPLNLVVLVNLLINLLNHGIPPSFGVVEEDSDLLGPNPAQS